MESEHIPSSSSANAALPSDFQDPLEPAASAGANHSKGPRDAHTLHLILHQYGVNAYQERVPLQLMDLAYRYTSGILQDSLHFINESYPDAPSISGAGGSTSKSNSDATHSVNLSTLRLAIRSRTHYQFNANLPKEFYADLGNEKNKIALPPVQDSAGLQLPPDQFLLTGTHWDMTEEFDTMDLDSRIIAIDHPPPSTGPAGPNIESGDEPEGGTVEDLFGRAGPEDEVMED